ncbi:hypothetical protein [Solimonas soli]|uniref:hypothetical protein n=1 Tax=Solimonas soli TaxID=413479 RepID=UPI000485D34B|nr:hypothetical protein [Solimonas soli]
MKALHLFNGVMLCLTATFAVTLGAVCVMYLVHLDELPRLRGEWHLVLQVTVLFTVLTAMSAAAFWAQWRHYAWRWPAEGALLLALAVGGWLLQRTLGGSP